MHRRMLNSINNYEKVGKGLESAVKVYNTSINNFDLSVIPQGRKFAGLAAGDEDAFRELAALSETPRSSRYAERDEEEVQQAADN